MMYTPSEQTFKCAFSVSEVHKTPVVEHFKVSDSRNESLFLKINAIEFKRYVHVLQSPSPHPMSEV